ncbi:MAG: hypothetical protein Q7W51_11280 [Coriobacteriia bacterium]|nr:hypothetical protein [Coriobacteriia bacterium]
MRISFGRVVATTIVAAMLLIPLFACGEDDSYRFKSDTFETKVGVSVDLEPSARINTDHGCACDPRWERAEVRNVDWGIDPPEGASVTSKGVFTATMPGTYVVTVYGELGSASTTVIVSDDEVLKQEDSEGEASGDVALSVDTGDAVEVFGTHSDASVNTGNPPNPTVFTLEEDTIITSVLTYHWNDGSGSAGGGKIGLVAKDGTKYGPWSLSKAADGQGGVPNAYWYVEPNIEIPAGTYTVTDSDPATWSWNDETGGMGVVIIMGIPQD